MGLRSRVLLLFLATIASTYSLEVAISFADGVSGRVSASRPNSATDIQINCLVKGQPRDFNINLNLIWFKRQGDGDPWIEVGREKNALNPPFANYPDKYETLHKYPFESDNDALFHLKIRGVETQDSGEYRCAAGTSDESRVNSDSVTLTVLPEAETTTLSLTTKSSKESGVYLFNVANEVMCSGTTESNSDQVELVVTLAKGDISPSFTLTKSIEWIESPAGLLKPKQSLTLFKKDWIPEITGQTILSCALRDGADSSRSLLIKNMNIRRDETASLVCTSNYEKREIAMDDIDVVISCDVKDYSKPTNQTVLKWSFFHKNETVNMYTGDYNMYQRSTYVVNNKHVMRISRVTAEMVAVGPVAEYTVVLLKDDKVGEIASTRYALKVDATRRISGSTEVASCIFLLLSAVVYHHI